MNKNILEGRQQVSKLTLTGVGRAALSLIGTALAGSVLAQQPVTTYGYDAQANLTSVTGPLSGTPNDLTSFTYDSLNRLKQMVNPLSGVTQYGYDGLDQVTSVTDPRGNVTSYTVDGLGNQTQEVSPDRGTTTMGYDAHSNQRHLYVELYRREIEAIAAEARLELARCLLEGGAADEAYAEFAAVADQWVEEGRQVHTRPGKQVR